jgi:hypothetical protein
MSSLAPPQSATLVSASGFHYQAPALSLLSGPHVAYNPPPTIGLGIGGFGFGSSGVGFGSGAGVGIPVGKPTVAEVSDQYIASAILPTPVDYRTKATPNNDRVGGIATRCGAEGTDSGVSRCGLSSPHGGWIIDSRAVCGG